MGDFTRRGVAVPPRQRATMLSGAVAMPDVAGIAAALARLYAGDEARDIDRADASSRRLSCRSAIASLRLTTNSHVLDTRD